MIFEFPIPIVKSPSNDEKESLNVALNNGRVIFVLGANGTGKSSLMYWFHTQQPQAVRVLSQRQASFPKEIFDMLASNRELIINLTKDFELRKESRSHEGTRGWEKVKLSMHSLIAAERVIRDEYMTMGREGASKEELDKFLSAKPGILSIINNLLKSANLSVEIFLESDRLFAKNNTVTDSKYSIIDLSDGERNALSIACEVLTAAKKNLIIIDEPERHLHRSIISPFLTALFAERKDCSFIISTHEVYLTIDNPEADVLILRGCQWQGESVSQWDVDMLKAGNENEIPEDIKKKILGPKRRILFVEGDSNSLDKQLYEALYENITVIPVGGCAEVEQRVKAMRKMGDDNDLHWLNVYGIVDGDGKTAEQKDELKRNNIVALDCYSVESLYYRREIVKRVATKHVNTYGGDTDDIYREAYDEILKNLNEERDNLCARKVEEKINNELIKSLPTWKHIKDNPKWEHSKNLADILEEEKKRFDELIEGKKWDSLIDRYPVKNSKVLAGISFPFGKDRHFFQSIVRQLVRKNEDNIKSYYKNDLLEDLTELIENNAG